MKIKFGKQGGRHTSVAITEMPLTAFNLLMVYARKGMDVEAMETEQLGLAMTSILRDKVKAIDAITEWRDKLLTNDEDTAATQEFEL
jgi:hypothetical protein